MQCDVTFVFISLNFVIRCTYALLRTNVPDEIEHTVQNVNIFFVALVLEK